MLTAHTKTIDGQEWTVTTLPAGVGMEIGSKLIRLLGPALGKAVSAAASPGQSLLDSESLPAIGEALTALSLSLGDPEAVALVKRLVTTGVHCGTTEVTLKTFDIHFAGDYLTMLKVAAFAIEANFGLPFGSWASAAQDGVVRMLASRPRPSGSSGSSAAGE